MKKILLVLLLAAVMFAIGCKTAEEDESVNMDITGTRWLYSDSDKSYDLEFRAGGVLYTHNPADTTPNNDFWSQNGNIVIWTFNNSYVTYTGTLNDTATFMAGSALNIVGTTWSWTATRY